jgi:hypothetical protein
MPSDMKIETKTAIGDHSKEIARIQRLLMAQELKERSTKRLSDYEFAKRTRLREEVVRLLEVMEGAGLSVEELTVRVGEMHPERKRYQSNQGSLQFPT